MSSADSRHVRAGLRNGGAVSNDPFTLSELLVQKFSFKGSYNVKVNDTFTWSTVINMYRFSVFIGCFVFERAVNCFMVAE